MAARYSAKKKTWINKNKDNNKKQKTEDTSRTFLESNYHTDKSLIRQ